MVSFGFRGATRQEGGQRGSRGTTGPGTQSAVGESASPRPGRGPRTRSCSRPFQRRSGRSLTRLWALSGGFFSFVTRRGCSGWGRPLGVDRQPGLIDRAAGEWPRPATPAVRPHRKRSPRATSGNLVPSALQPLGPVPLRRSGAEVLYTQGPQPSRPTDAIDSRCGQGWLGDSLRPHDPAGRQTQDGASEERHQGPGVWASVNKPLVDCVNVHRRRPGQRGDLSARLRDIVVPFVDRTLVAGTESWRRRLAGPGGGVP